MDEALSRPIKPATKDVLKAPRYLLPIDISLCGNRCAVGHMAWSSTLSPQPGSPGPADSELSTLNPGKVVGLATGAYVELPSAFRVIIGLVASHLADGRLQFIDIDHVTCKSIYLRQVRRPEGPGTRTAPRVCQTHARPLPGLRLVSQLSPSFGGRGDRRGRRGSTRLLPPHPPP